MVNMSELGDATLPFIGIIVVFNLCHKMNALYIWASFAFICYLNSALKSVYAEPRPFWVSNDILPVKCRPDFGSPSGHCMVTTFFWLTLYLQKYYEVGHKVHIKSIFCTEYIVKMALTAVMIMFFMMVAISRVYLGEHSYN